MSKARPAALVGGIVATAIVSAWAIFSGWLASQPTDVAIPAVVGWFAILLLMIVRNIF